MNEEIDVEQQQLEEQRTEMQRIRDRLVKHRDYEKGHIRQASFEIAASMTRDMGHLRNQLDSSDAERIANFAVQIATSIVKRTGDV